MIIRKQEQEEDCVTEERNIKKCEEKPTVNENTDGKEQQKQQQQQHTTIRTHTVIFAKHKEETKGTIHQSVSHSTAISGCGNVCNFLSHQLYRISDSDRISSIDVINTLNNSNIYFVIVFFFFTPSNCVCSTFSRANICARKLIGFTQEK